MITAVRINSKEQFDIVVDYNDSNGFKMIGGVNHIYHVNRNCVEIGSHFQCFNEWLSPLSFDRHIISFTAFEAACLTLMN